MTTANWLQLLGTIVVLAVTWGGVQSRLKQVERSTRDSEKSRGGQGARIGILEERLAHLEGATSNRRRSTTRGLSVDAEAGEDDR